MSIAERVDFMRDGMLVRRYHQYTTHETDTVGKHSAGVALFAQMIDPGCRKEVLLGALFHDLGEGVLGDIPSPTKKMLSQQCRDELDAIELKALEANGYPTELLTDSEVSLLKLCDCLDGLAFCVEELNRGNRSIRGVGDKYSAYIADHLGTSACQYDWYMSGMDVYSVLTYAWRNANEVR